jgi:1-aminocyclopropane-1-carboxylate synthase
MFPTHLSSRSVHQETNGILSDLIPYFHRIEQNPFNEKINPCGIINLGLAENMLCEEELTNKLVSLQAWCSALNHYGDPLGELSFRQELCHFFHEHLQLDNSIELTPDRMIITGGAASAFVVYSYMLSDMNDVILIPSPYYSYIDHNVSVVTENHVVRCPLIDQQNGLFKLSRESFEQGYNEALTEGLNPRMILLINPNNPLGDVYDETTLLPILQFAAEKSLHVVIDEVYALSTFLTCSFQSILNYRTLLPDPDRTHFLWSFSKDFSLNGARVGVMYTGTKEICQLSSKINFLFVPSRNTQFMLQQLISDHEWIRYYIVSNRQRLTQRYTQVKLALETIEGVKVRRSHAGFFIWVDLRELMPEEPTFDDETRLFEHLFDCAGIFILRGQILGCTQPGWFRIVFSVNDAMICEALLRMKTALTERFCGHFLM